ADDVRRRRGGVEEGQLRRIRRAAYRNSVLWNVPSKRVIRRERAPTARKIGGTMGTPVDDAALDTLFRTARSQNKWLDKPVSTEQLIAIYDVMKWGPTSANSFPARIIFVTSEQGKKSLATVVFEGNRSKVMTAPVTAIIGFDR